MVAPPCPTTLCVCVEKFTLPCLGARRVEKAAAPAKGKGGRRGRRSGERVLRRQGPGPREGLPAQPLRQGVCAGRATRALHDSGAALLRGEGGGEGGGGRVSACGAEHAPHPLTKPRTIIFPRESTCRITWQIQFCWTRPPMGRAIAVWRVGMPSSELQQMRNGRVQMLHTLPAPLDSRMRVSRPGHGTGRRGVDP